MIRRHAEKGAPQRPVARDQRALPMRAQPTICDGALPGVQPTAVDYTPADVQALKHECDQLKTELEGLRLHCQRLEANTAHVSNRLAWAVDTIESLIENKG